MHLWIVHDEDIVDIALLESYRKLLTKEESERYQSFYFPKHRHQYLITRALLRCVLSLYVDCVKPHKWHFGKNQYGKPFIHNTIPVPLHFNISHTEKMIVMVIACSANVGVDVERVRYIEEMIEITSRYFSQGEAQHLLRLSEDPRRDRFFDIWTLKEAYIKACGEGLSISLNHFSYIFSESGAANIIFALDRDDIAEHWQFWRVFPNDSHKIAIAYKNQLSHVPCSLLAREIVPLSGFRKIVVPSISSMGSTLPRIKPVRMP